jgi:hypothetical protein
MTEDEKRFIEIISRLTAEEVEHVKNAVHYCIRCQAEQREPDYDILKSVIFGTNEPDGK